MDEKILFAGFADDSSASSSANCVVVLLESGRVSVLKDMQFNMLNSQDRRINFELVEPHQQVNSLMVTDKVSNAHTLNRVV